MPVFKAGISIGMSISSALGVPFYKTTHQEGHIEAALRSIDFKRDNFIAIHMSGGTTEVLRVSSNGKGYDIEILGGTKDISFGQFIDRIGVALGLSFPSGKYIDEYALGIKETSIRIPSHVEGLYFNLSGQETMGLKYVKSGYNHKEIAFAAMLCVGKTLEKVIKNLRSEMSLPVLLIGGVASSKFLKAYYKNKGYNYIHFSHERYASDNAVGDAYIGSKIYEKGEIL
jgi:N6-L-threonylcarbamoyladenine synthase